MTEPSLVLLVSENSAHVPLVREALTGEEPFAVQHVERARTAAARIAGGGVALVLLDITSRSAEAPPLFLAIRSAADDFPIILLCEADEKRVAEQIVQDGARGYVARSDWQRDLKRRVLAELERPTRVRTHGRRGTVITVLGAKGGVGATTVATNVASALASSSSVILAELRPPFGSFCHFFRPHRAARGLQHLLAPGRDAIKTEDVESCLWPNRNVPGLSVLFAPDKLDASQEMKTEDVREVLRRASELCEVVVVDVSPALSDVDRAVLAESDTMALVVERDALSIDAAKTKLSALEAEALVPQQAGSVIVNRVPLASPLALAEIESQLGIPTFAVIPPAADLCAAAYRVHTPVVQLDRESSMAVSLLNLAKRLSGG